MFFAPLRPPTGGWIAGFFIFWSFLGFCFNVSMSARGEIKPQKSGRWKVAQEGVPDFLSSANWRT